MSSSSTTCSSTPTLFHSGTPHPQLSSCYLTTVGDISQHIFKCLGDNAQLSKWSGGIGNDWSRSAPPGSHIQSTNVDSQGVVPFLKIANDVTMAINRSGKRRGATCAYLETWHYDIEDFLDLRKNTGDDRRRTHDMNTANWIPDLFMKRVQETGATGRLFSPDETPDLHETFGAEFERTLPRVRGEGGARRAAPLQAGLEAIDLWRKMLTMLFETGHPWMTFKDACNVRSPQDHVGVIHSSNLCTEITLNTSAEETAVCNLGSVNLARHCVRDGQLDRRAPRANGSDGDPHARQRDRHQLLPDVGGAELQHAPSAHRSRAAWGFQDVLYQLDIPFDSAEAADMADRDPGDDQLSRHPDVVAAGKARAGHVPELRRLQVGAAGFCLTTPSICWSRNAGFRSRCRER